MDATRNFFIFRRLFPVLLPMVFSFRSALVAAHSHNLRLGFLRRCLEEQVLPPSLLPRRLLQFGDRPFEEFHRLVLLRSISMKKEEVREAFKTSRRKKRDLLAALPIDWRKCIFDFCYQKLRNKCNCLRLTLDNKITVLIANSNWSIHANEDFVINLSDVNIDPSSLPALGYGLSFSITPSTPDYVSITNAFCNLEKYGNISQDSLNICKGFIYGVSSLKSHSNVPLRFLKVYEHLRKNENLHITKADKSNALVVLNKQDYLDKMVALLSDSDTYSLLNSNPTERISGSFNKKLKCIFKGKPTMIKQFMTISPSLPYLYGLIKTHKPNNPIRPIISSVGSATYKLSKWLVTILTPVVGTISTSHIKNNVDLIDKLNNVNVNFQFKMVSFDVTSLFTKVPVSDLLEYLSEILDNFELPLPTQSILALIKLCVVDSVFSFDGRFYLQKFGMAMGNPLSPVLSNIYMECFETKFLPRVLPAHAKWYRYVDDVLCIWPISENIIDFLTLINSQVDSIKFTYEEERDLCLPFLDINIHRTSYGFQYNIYRKPTNICSYIHYYSNHSDNIKKATFSTMFLRAFRVCSPPYLQAEFDTIYDIGRKLRYPDSFISCALEKARRTFYSIRRSEPFNLDNLLVLPYNDLYRNVPEFLNSFNINVIFSYPNTVRNILIRNAPKKSEGCIYKIPCKECNNFYVGQTGKTLSTRLKQHQYSVRVGQTSSALFLHMNNCNHRIDWEGADTILYCNNITKRNIIESAFIKYHSDLINISPGLYKLDQFVVEMIFKLVSR